MKPIVYLAAFQFGGFTLDTVVPDEPVGLANGAGQEVKWIANYDGLFKGPIPVRVALAESRNCVAVWLAQQIGVDSVLRTARTLGILTPLRPFPTTALGASEVTLLELANAYRAIASGLAAQPYVIRSIVRDSGETLTADRATPAPLRLEPAALFLIQEGLRGVVRLPGGTARALNSQGFPIAVMAKTGTTSEFRDALFVGSTYGSGGITVAVRIGFDDNRSLGPDETGGRVALPVFQEVLLRAYGEKLLGPVPGFPAAMEQRISAALDDGMLDSSLPPAAFPLTARR
jgi:membrane peptidoglycan carboxypeptidase